ncbi:hypothetical protein [Aeoliella sp.]|uniref:hypothetical protein n=1 Tax=Aeoliella sp. TaxID=2795800 RepID=UPI003CCBF090
MDDPKYYIAQAYRHLMTESELRANQALIYDIKSKGDTWLDERRDQLLATLEAAELFRKGRDQFLSDLMQRLLTDHPNEIVRCEKCGHIVRTAKAKQCLRCGHDWH